MSSSGSKFNNFFVIYVKLLKVEILNKSVDGKYYRTMIFNDPFDNFHMYEIIKSRLLMSNKTGDSPILFIIKFPSQTCRKNH